MEISLRAVKMDVRIVKSVIILLVVSLSLVLQNEQEMEQRYSRSSIGVWKSSRTVGWRRKEEKDSDRRRGEKEL